MADFDPHTFTQNLIADLRANGGVATMQPMAGRPLVILTTTGARSGEPRTAVLTNSTDGDRLVIAASAGGSPKEPAWYHNLVADPIVTVETGGQTYQARATLQEAAEHDRLWKNHVAARPEFADYPEKSGREIPMITLERIAS